MGWKIALPIQCLVCGLPANASLSLCASCADALPWQPQGCLRCGEVLPEVSLYQGVCGDCRVRPSVIDRCQSALCYEAPVDTLVQRFKFRADFACGRVLAELLTRCMSTQYKQHEQYDDTRTGALLVPVPLHPSRQRRRGFNQARELARPLTRALGIPLSLSVLSRSRRTHTQSESSSAGERRRNLRNAFQAHKVGLVGVNKVILIDDVITTMSTVLAAADALKRAGVSEVEAWSVARVNQAGRN
ncbi:MAG: ComF family protein [Pseudohongiellaceae bacterium]